MLRITILQGESTLAKAIKIHQIKTKPEEARYLVKQPEDELAGLQA